MNNILDFYEYKMKVRLYEESVMQSYMSELVNEGLGSKIRKKINTKATIFVTQALSDEIEMGKKLNEEIQKGVDELKEYIDKVQKFVDKSNQKKSDLFKNIEKIFDDIHKSSFELLEILSGVKINFSDYVTNATMAVFVNFGVMFIPIRATFLLKKSYKYFIGLVKNTIRKDLLMLMLNFDQFENTVLIQSLEDDEVNMAMEKLNAQNAAVDQLIAFMMGEKSKKGQSYKNLIKDVEKASKLVKQKFDMELKTLDRRAPSIGFDTRYDNTYTKTLDQLKSFVLEDDSKYLEGIKNGMRSLALDEADTKTFVELLISAAEECAYEVSNAIHTNFIEKVSVFKLANQKRLIELVKKDKEMLDKKEMENMKKREEKLSEKKNRKISDMVEDKGPELLKKVLESDDQVEAFENLEDIEVDKTKYDGRTVLTDWLSILNDKHKFENWETNKDKIDDRLKLRIMAVPNRNTYTKYADTLVECLLPCAEEDIETEGKRSKITKRGKVFSAIPIKDVESRMDRIKLAIYEEEDKSTPEKPSFKKDKKGKYIVDDNKKKILKDALGLISENLVHLDEDVILEAFEKMMNDEYMMYEVGEKILNDVRKQLNRLKELKDNDYYKESSEDDEDKTKKG